MTRSVVAALVLGAMVGAADRPSPAALAVFAPVEGRTPASTRAARQAPSSQSRQTPPISPGAPVAVYHVWIRTGTAWRAGTNARIHIEITGTAATGIIRLDTPRHDDFQRGSVRRYETPPLRLGEPLSFSLTSDGGGFGPDWLVDYVCVGTDPDPEVSCSDADRAWLNEWIRGPSTTQVIDLPRRH